MEIFNFFIFPAALFGNGIIICLFLLLEKPQEMKHSRGDMQIGKINRQMFMQMSKEKRSAFVKLLALATLICTLFTSLVALLFASLLSPTLAAFFGCLALQLLVFFCLWIPCYRRLYRIAQR